MDEDWIDVSAGLIFSLELLALHQLSGTLQAELHRIPGIPKKSIARLDITNGVVVSCSVTDQQGRQYPMAKDVLIQLNEEKGPFEWSFHPAKPTQPHRTPNQEKPSHTAFQHHGPVAVDTDTFIPRIIAPMDWHRLHHWTSQQRQALSMVGRVIDGKHTIRDIKEVLKGSLPSAFVDEALQTLLALSVIVLTRQGEERVYREYPQPSP
ncbi:MAG: hypothetical protein J2P36_04115 [Ktedonobacteraceae bacterium]|nr:hypothetical protein [Ktedonobacteraceae bacterium]